MLAGGCAVGAGVSGAAVFALTAWLALIGMWAGAGVANGGIAAAYSGNYFSHASISGSGLSNLVSDEDGDIVFGGQLFGNGFVAFGGQTTTNFHDPENDAFGLRVNELLYVANAVGNNVLEPASLALLALGILGIAASRRKA